MLRDPSSAKLVHLVEDPRLDALQDHTIRELNLPVRAGVRNGGPVDADVVVIAESEEFIFGELRAIVRDDGVWNSKAMDDVKEEVHGLLRFDHGDWPGFHPLHELVHGNDQMHVALLEGPNQIEPPDHKWPRDGYRLERLGW
jgi:hypothetical protein